MRVTAYGARLRVALAKRTALHLVRVEVGVRVRVRARVRGALVWRHRGDIGEK